ncbi:hypothetical protein TNCV_4473131 [Trichonephila clavipes]|uniref:Uncharacterized protein n=1 Tax=Trichonephila clavipes TaxID=2585209 RepID=A0A8X6VM03_TRICX|nr:hypothetical protein TNCV_4473131 [Trichonephila clavipes]
MCRPINTRTWGFKKTVSQHFKRVLYRSIWTWNNIPENGLDAMVQFHIQLVAKFKPIEDVTELRQRIAEAVDEINLACYSKISKWSLLKIHSGTLKIATQEGS